MKIELGAGYEQTNGFITIDYDEKTNPNYVINLDDVNVKLPFDDNSVDEIRAHHILEHIGGGFIPLMIELYRVSKHGAIVDIVVPHHHHEVFYGDATHKRPITISMFSTFSREHEFTKEGKVWSSSLAHRYNVDFRVIWYDFVYDSFYWPLIDKVNKLKQEGELSQDDDFMFQRLMREALNVVQDTKIKLQVIKE